MPELFFVEEAPRAGGANTLLGLVVLAVASTPLAVPALQRFASETALVPPTFARPVFANLWFSVWS